MRQFLITFLFLVCSVCTFAQTDHMKFKGIPMDGTLQSFTDKLKTKGYTPMGISDGISMLTGEFAGYKDCTLFAVSDKSGMICKVTVLFPSMDKWRELENCYANFKSMLSEKYGKPKICVEEFQSQYVDDDNDRIYELKMDRCKYYSVFSQENGDIQLEITHNKSDCKVMLSYFDNANQDKLRQRIMDDL